MDDDETPTMGLPQPRRTEGQLELCVWASQEQLDRGIEAALEVFMARGVAPGRAAVCSAAVTAYRLDPSLPEPDAEVQAADEAFQEASDAAILAAGGMLNQDNELRVSQSPADRELWNTLPTLRAWRARTSKRRILSLDFDGVLHPSPRHLPRQEVPVFAWLDHLEPLLEAHPDVGLLVHSSWRETYERDEIQDMLHPMEHRFAGVAPPGERGAAIEAWRQRNARDSQMLAIDDDCELQELDGIEVLHCDPRLGISDIAVQRAISDWLERTRPSAQL